MTNPAKTPGNQLVCPECGTTNVFEVHHYNPNTKDVEIPLVPVLGCSDYGHKPMAFMTEEEYFLENCQEYEKP